MHINTTTNCNKSRKHLTELHHAVGSSQNLSVMLRVSFGGVGNRLGSYLARAILGQSTQVAKPG